ncbi:MAG: phosphatidate cytidylyltransferase [Opitutales bacterium]|nr:phosphatidate cytidylyltransferase [Opitutales bacterium]
MLMRTLSTLTLWGLVFGTVYFFKETGGVWLLTLAAVLTQAEINSLLTRMNQRPLRIEGLLIGATIIPLTYYWQAISAEDLLAAAIVLTVSASLFRTSGSRGAYLRRLPATYFGILYAPFLIHFYPRILQTVEDAGRRLENDAELGFGMFFVLWIVAVSKFSDMGALLVGRGIGRTKMAPSISPGKTVEGLLGGIATATLVGAGLPFLFPQYIPKEIAFDFDPQTACLLSIPIAVVAVIGDLIASVLKRLAGVKDSGGVIPGIGGMLDLFDSLILSAPVGYLLLRCFLL